MGYRKGFAPKKLALFAGAGILVLVLTAAVFVSRRARFYTPGPVATRLAQRVHVGMSRDAMMATYAAAADESDGSPRLVGIGVFQADGRRAEYIRYAAEDGLIRVVVDPKTGTVAAVEAMGFAGSP